MNREPNNRLSVRVNVSFPLNFKKLEKKKYELIKDNFILHRTCDREKMYSDHHNRLSVNFSDRKMDKLDPAILQIGESICMKLDVIINLLREEKDDYSDFTTGVCKNVSMNGIMMVTESNIKQNDYVELRLDFPVFPPLIIMAVGQVRESTVSGNLNHASISLVAINDDDREELVGYIFKRQREILRKRKDSN